MSAKKNNLWTVLYALWLALVLWLSLDSSPPKVDYGLLGWDKFQHAAAYGLMTLLGGLGLGRWMRPAVRRWLVSGGIAVSIGLLVEVAQGMMRAGRFADWYDAAANTLGVAGSLLLVALVSSLRSRPSAHR